MVLELALLTEQFAQLHSLETVKGYCTPCALACALTPVGR